MTTPAFLLLTLRLGGIVAVVAGGLAHPPARGCR